MATKKRNEIVLDQYQKKVLKYVADGENLFITGKAGTGKTYLLKEIKKMYEGKKVIAVLAPTGVAARNAEGFTMHSFLRLPLKPYLPRREMRFFVEKLNNSLYYSIFCYIFASGFKKELIYGRRYKGEIHKPVHRLRFQEVVWNGDEQGLAHQFSQCSFQ